MTALRIDNPAGIAPPVWLAHLARLGLQAHLRGELPVDPASPPGTLMAPGAREAAEAASEA